MKFRFHVIALPHTQTTRDYIACAYTQKVIKFCRMMKSLGHEVFLYASEENEAPCDELITIVNKSEQRKWFGKYDFKQQFFNIDWNETLPHWTIPNARAITEIKKRAKPRDFICIIAGICQKQISDALPQLMSVEYGIGYYGVYAPFRVYESYAQMHYVHGQQQNDNGRFFDAVIPNYFDPAEFPYQTKKDDFYLYVGRMIRRKGPEMAAEVTKRLGAKLVLIGQGVNKIVGNKIMANELTLEGDHLLHLGHADVKKRGELMSRAKAVFLLSYYLEPFGGTSIEPLFCGTPVITTDWGAFPENIPHGVVGYRARTLGEAVWAAQNVHKLQPRVIRDYAMKNFSLNRVKYLYQAYFEQLYTLWEENGWYSNWHRGVSRYQRYTKYYPSKN
ncbi:glycosyltransferase [Candidatus Saccharibacteria bacterium]|nr:glycosyltransferase [Candidatus Saccharibacteria bacterium]